jgi:hypothetical protein
MVSKILTVPTKTQTHAHWSVRIHWDQWRLLLASARVQRNALHALVLTIAVLSLVGAVR